MTTQLSLAALLVQETKDVIYAGALAVATTLGLPVTSWAPGDPTRSTFYVEASFLEVLENVVVGYVQSAFLDYAAVPNADGTPNPWLAILAQQVFNVTVPGATYATTTVTLTNAGGGIYVLQPGDLSLKNSATGATYTNKTAITLTGVGTTGATGSVTVVADGPFAGTAGSAGAGEIDTVVSGFNGVTCTNPAAAVGLNAQDPQTTVQQCRNKLGSLSPNGPASAYSYVALNSTLTGVTSVNRVRTYPDSTTGNVSVVVAGPSGTVSGPDVSSVQTAINTWATPLCITPTVQSAAPVTVPVTYQIWIYQSVNASSATIQANILTALQNFFAARPIGGDIIPPATTGTLYQSMIAAEIGAVYPKDTFRVVVSAPAGDTALTTSQVSILGTVTPTVTFISVPS
jgi:Baseplate J-like protein